MYQSNKYNELLNVSSKRIKEYREKNKLSLSALSIKLELMGVDIPKQSLHKIENGKRIVKDFELYAISHVLKVSMEDLIEDFILEINKDEIV